jgi:hypothetical protein
MFPLRPRLAIAGVVAAAIVAVPAVALASGPGSSAGKPTATQTSAVGPGKPGAGTSRPKVPAPGGFSKSAAAQAVPEPRVYGLAAVTALAARLHVSSSVAGPAFKQIGALLAETGRVDTASPAFAAIAHQLGVSPAQLAAAWNAVEQGGASQGGTGA